MTKLENNIRQLCESVINGAPLVPLAQEIFDFYELPEIRGSEIQDGKMYRNGETLVKAEISINNNCIGCNNLGDYCGDINCMNFIFKEV